MIYAGEEVRNLGSDIRRYLLIADRPEKVIAGLINKIVWILVYRTLAIARNLA